MKLILKIHRWGGLLIAPSLIFYCLSGVLLNHRQYFDYFVDQEKSTALVAITDTTPLKSLVANYTAMTGQKDAPTVIKIKADETIELLYGSHGAITYTISPGQGTMTRVEKRVRQPWSFFNNLHKSYKTSSLWIYLSDIIAMLVVTITLSTFFTMRYKFLDILFLVAGVVLMSGAMVLG